MRQWPDRTGAQRAVFGKDMVAIYQNSPENNSVRQWPDRTGAQRAVFGKDMVAIYQNSPSYVSFFVSSITTQQFNNHTTVVK